MPLSLLTRFTELTSLQRTPRRDRHLGMVLAFVAGATNAGGFLAVGQYTSHMTGIVSHAADMLVLQKWMPVIVGLLAFIFFVLGSMFSTWCIHWSLRRRLQSAYGLPFLFQAGSMVIFGLFGSAISQAGHLLVPLTVLQLCYLMGMQNAAFGQISLNNARSTHITGMTTDLGVELGKLTYYNRTLSLQKVMADRFKLWSQVAWLMAFFTGAVVGSWGFNRVGYITTVPLAIILILLTLEPLWYDVRKLRKLYALWRRRKPRMTGVWPSQTNRPE